eukprot:GGOE01049320.1.p1 GENE.GGOE01049320.1~~GGOE01049320.1.p1  ORF type:complete len:258 (+),score=82.88 GGOE01049320.1:46-819(+)
MPECGECRDMYPSLWAHSDVDPNLIPSAPSSPPNDEDGPDRLKSNLSQSSVEETQIKWLVQEVERLEAVIREKDVALKAREEHDWQLREQAGQQVQALQQECAAHREAVAAKEAEVERLLRQLGGQAQEAPITPPVGSPLPAPMDLHHVVAKAKDLEVRSLMAEVDGLRKRAEKAEAALTECRSAMEEEAKAVRTHLQAEVAYWRQRSVASLAKCMKRCEEQMAEQQAAHNARQDDLLAQISFLEQRITSLKADIRR